MAINGPAIVTLRILCHEYLVYKVMSQLPVIVLKIFDKRFVNTF